MLGIQDSQVKIDQEQVTTQIPTMMQICWLDNHLIGIRIINRDQIHRKDKVEITCQLGEQVVVVVVRI